ncbi:hypothetical protein F5050DRAFT_1720946 [Lentinula boryana]|uniref:Uncharacterized protein n=1 Tax=Lentinula boryana TaxID=40481 RepID=A0ABQ8QTX7_9AGAR|nr:hypothetical protein F5050DRAFT_1720946 [Lentinula boryana]
MHLPIPCTSPVEISNFLGFSPKFANSSPTCSLYLLTLIGLAILGVAVSFKYFLVRKSRTKQGNLANQQLEKEQTQTFQRRTWITFINGWDGIHWPVTLTVPPTSTSVGRGVGLNGAVLGKHMSQPIPNNSSFDQRLPTIYQSKEPISMAKMIMSRHTFRRPSSPVPTTSQATTRHSAPLPLSPAPSKPQSMV